MTTSAIPIGIQNSEAVKINKMLRYLIVLNILDGLLTHIGVTTQYVVEVNRLMVDIVSNFQKLMLYKILLPTCALLLVMHIFHRCQYKDMPVARFFVKICFWVYLAILFLHIFWIVMVLYGFIS
ncbi:MAG: DUF5658 family protein [Clostridia bacterium]|nr:DUF5658 family protein [Clostridia bacterium]